MTLQRSLIIVSIVLGIGITSFLLVIFRLNPYSAPHLSMPLFYVSFFFFVSGLFTLAGFFTRFFARRKDEEFYNPMNVSLRQGILLGASVTVLMGFQSLRTLTIWDSVLVVIIIVLIEVYFMARERTGA